MMCLPLWLCPVGALIFSTACSYPAPVNNTFGFHPDSSKVYAITWMQQEGGDWPDSTKRGASLEKIGMELQLLGTVDSVYRLKLVFVNYRKDFSPMHMVFNGVREDDIQDSIITRDNIKNNAPNRWQYLLNLTQGLSLEVWMSNNGEVTKVAGFDLLADSVAARAGFDRREVASSLRDYVGDEIMQERLTQVFTFVPGRARTPGQNWVIDQKLLSKAPVLHSNMYVLERVNADTASITVQGGVSARQGEQGRVYMLGKLAGTIIAGYSTGIPYHYRARIETVMTLDSSKRSNKQTTDVTVQELPLLPNN